MNKERKNKVANLVGSLVLVFSFPVLFFSFSAAASPMDDSCGSRYNGHCFTVGQAAIGQAQTFTGIQGMLGLDEKAEIGDVLAALYRFALGLVGLSALVMIVFGGITYMSAGDSQERVNQAKGFIQNAILGLVLALLSYLILRTINPELTAKLDIRLAPINIKPQGLELFQVVPLSDIEKRMREVNGVTILDTTVIKPEEATKITAKELGQALDVKQDECTQKGGVLLPNTPLGGGSIQYVCQTCPAGTTPTPLPKGRVGSGPRGYCKQ